MARMEITGFDSFAEVLKNAADRLDARGAEAVRAGSEVAVNALKAAAPVRTGGLRNSIKADAPKIANGVYADIYPRGTDAHGERYATIGFVLEYGRSNMAPRPWMRPTVDAHANEVQAAMARTLLED